MSNFLKVEQTPTPQPCSKHLSPRERWTLRHIFFSLPTFSQASDEAEAFNSLGPLELVLSFLSAISYFTFRIFDETWRCRV